MPTYEYACSNCKHAWEEQQKMSDAALETCPSCLQKTAKRQISSGGVFILKGGGWYSDLYSTPKSETKSDGKPEHKSESSPSPKTTEGGDVSNKVSKPATPPAAADSSPKQASPSTKSSGSQ